MEKLNFCVSDVGDNGLVINAHKSPSYFSDLESSLYARDQIKLDSDILIIAEVEKIDKQLYLNGHLELTIQSPCSRCLTMVSKNISPGFSIILLPENKDNDEFVCDEDAMVESYRGNVVDITDYLYEVLSMSLPVKFLCRKNCKGLCMYCGTNMNEINCECKDKQVYNKSTFSVLKNYKI